MIANVSYLDAASREMMWKFLLFILCGVKVLNYL